jgi:hypothetical protein
LAAGQGPPCAHRIIAFDASGRARCDTCGWRERGVDIDELTRRAGERIDGEHAGETGLTRWHLAAAAHAAGVLP